MVTLAAHLVDPASSAAAIAEASAIIASRAVAPGVKRPEVRDRLAALTPADFNRSEYSVREAAQEEALDLPPLPTTTIGSFPQTSEIRGARARANKGVISGDGILRSS